MFRNQVEVQSLLLVERLILINLTFIFITVVWGTARLPNQQRRDCF